MNKKSFTLTLSAFLLATTAIAQNEEKFTGIWEGKLNVGVELRIIFHVSRNEHGNFTATADSPDQSAFGLKCDTVIISRDSVRITMNNLNASFAGKLTTDSTINGQFKQGNFIPLSLKKVNTPTEVKKRQTPIAPFPYKSEEVEYWNAAKTLRYGATITIPNGTGRFPAAVLITGSGPQDRDETILGHKVFAVLADALTKNGFVVLRVDDRGVGKTTGVFIEATSADFADDVNTSLDYLLARPETDKKKTGLIGHSEGGMIAPLVASQRKDIDFLVLLAAPGIKIDKLMDEQNAAILRSARLSEPAISAYLPFYKDLMNRIIASNDSKEALASAKILFQEWMARTDSTLIKELGFNEVSGDQIIERLVHEFSMKWFRYFLAFDPQPYLQKLNTKVLALNGSKDIQIIASSNLAGIKTALEKSKTKKYTIRELPGLNHLFQTCNTCTLAEYGILDETFSPVALKEINDWLDKYVK